MIHSHMFQKNNLVLKVPLGNAMTLYLIPPSKKLNSNVMNQLSTSL